MHLATDIGGNGSGVIERCERRGFGDVKQAHLGRQHLVLGDVENAELHVGLTGAQPDVADQDVFDHHRVLSGDAQCLRCGAGVDLRQLDAPFSVGAGFGFGGAITEGDGDLFTRFGPAPDGNGGVLLEDHVVAEQAGHAHIGRERDKAGQQADGCEQKRG